MSIYTCAPFASHRQTFANMFTHKIDSFSSYYCYCRTLMTFHFIQWLFLLDMGDNKSPQFSRTFLRILADCSITVFYISSKLVSIPSSFALFLMSFGGVSNAPMTMGTTFTLISQIKYCPTRRNTIRLSIFTIQTT